LQVPLVQDWIMLMLTEATAEVVVFESVSSQYHHHPIKTHSSVSQEEAFRNMQPQFFDWFPSANLHQLQTATLRTSFTYKAFNRALS